jgi:hypothetical protein
MKRAVFAALAVAAALPASAAAQLMPVQDESVWGPRIRVTPFVGTAPTVSRTERWTVLTNGAAPASTNFEVDLGSGPAAGAVLDVRLVERFNFVASGIYISRGRTREFSTAGGDVFDHPGSNFLVAKAGISMRLREPVSELQFRRLSASVFAGPAYIRETPKDDLFSDPMLLESLSHWGANFGVDADIPLGWRSLALQAGIEDVVVWWNDAETASRMDNIAALDGFATETSIQTDPSHMLLFRAGLSFRFR